MVIFNDRTRLTDQLEKNGASRFFSLSQRLSADGLTISVLAYNVSMAIAILAIVLALLVCVGAILYITRSKSARASRPFATERRVYRADCPPSAAADGAAVDAYRKILSARTHPSAGLIESVTDAERDAYAALGTGLPVVVAYASHPHRRNAILNLIEACQDVYLVIVGNYAQGLEPKRGVTVKEFGAARLAAFVFDGILRVNPRYLKLCAEKEGLTVGGRRFSLLDAPLSPVEHELYRYAVDPASSAAVIETYAATKYVFKPGSELVSVTSKNGVVRVVTESGTLTLRCNVPVTARPVWCDGLAVRLITKGAAHLTVGEPKSADVFDAHAAWCKRRLIADFSAEGRAEELKTLFIPVMRRLLNYRRTNVIGSFLDAAAVTVGSFETVPLSALQVRDAVERALCIILLLSVKSARGVSLTENEHVSLARAVMAVREGEGFNRAAAYRMLTLLDKVDRAAINKEYLTVVTDVLTLVQCAEKFTGAERAVALSLLTNKSFTEVDLLIDNCGVLREPVQIAAAFLVRSQLLGVRYTHGRLTVEPTLKGIESITVLGQRLDWREGARFYADADSLARFDSGTENGLTTA